jgi:hypothetical protein
MDTIDTYYDLLKHKIVKLVDSLVPYCRRLIRFLALPYAYFFLVDWDECQRARLKVLLDFAYIFFVLKDYPDYYSKFRLWEKERSEWKYYYGSTYNPYQRYRLSQEVQKKEYSIVFEDKYICDKLCAQQNIPIPKFLGFIEPHTNYKSYLYCLLNYYSRLIVKPVRGRGGKNIVHVERTSDNDIFIYDNMNYYSLNDYNLVYPSIIQEYIIQHKDLDWVSSSTNTIRTETMLSKNNQVVVLGAFARFGLNNSFLDNQSAGGLSVGINLNTGKLFNTAKDSKGKLYYTHPDSQIAFYDFKIPYWNQVIELSKQIQLSFPFYKLLGPDIAITEKGPVVIEINGAPDHAGLEMDYGPVLKDEQVWRIFQEYNLLYNKPSQTINRFSS